MKLRIAVAALSVPCVLISGCARYTGDTEEVTFSGAGGATLHGTLVLPPASPPFPAVVVESERAEPWSMMVTFGLLPSSQPFALRSWTREAWSMKKRA